MTRVLCQGNVQMSVRVSMSYKDQGNKSKECGARLSHVVSVDRSPVNRLCQPVNSTSQPWLSLFPSPETLGFRSNNLADPALICLTCPLPRSTLEALYTPCSASSITSLSKPWLFRLRSGLAACSLSESYSNSFRNPSRDLARGSRCTTVGCLATAPHLVWDSSVETGLVAILPPSSSSLDGRGLADAL